ncbi:unnamed protein product [Paramecium sonneborni]|uniref:Uncharacterized protein n=1 Tax=Paramecium sonneborni TaxID=65129 RepID=A0A8S1PH73_9CILI|nr:unnamed protein product [Paramecium sonneborni]
MVVNTITKQTQIEGHFIYIKKATSIIIQSNSFNKYIGKQCDTKSMVKFFHSIE